MNILISGAGRRVKMVKYFKEELSKVGGKIVAVDCDPTASVVYWADAFEIVPCIDHPDYIQVLKHVCRKHDIRGVISLIDLELPLLASYKEEFQKENISLIVSDKEVIDICFDKYATYEFLQKHNIPTVPTYLNLDELMTDMDSNKVKFPLIVKPRRGSSSIGVCKVHSIKELQAVLGLSQEYIIQPFIEGDEYGTDCYVDMLTQRPVNIFCKRKIKMRAGETDKSLAIKDPDYISLIERLIEVLKPIGPIDIDCFKYESGYVISEVNPRFRGGYLHAHEVGQNFIKKIINNMMGTTNVSNVGNYNEGSIMIKYDDVKILSSFE
ncbi:ATP-grasp domain-containing protein [Bacillus sp. 165]|uniref:ATP-grasp domain-containing protein n=1 Tax=Bacillus sp. 165 TaxID=1529117 RepID=UPI001ADB103D|nr:ATP-grasp domain-containing protein [Bacillus sp. 165]MBO9129996.1 ATP-grasp domain-containing protein [Bacillus sp. 165]